MDRKLLTRVERARAAFDAVVATERGCGKVDVNTRPNGFTV